MSGPGFKTQLADWHGGRRRMEWEQRCGRSKLDEAKVRQLRRATIDEAKRLAVEFGISKGVALRVRRRQAWIWVADTEG